MLLHCSPKLWDAKEPNVGPIYIHEAKSVDCADVIYILGTLRHPTYLGTWILRVSIQCP